MESTFCLVRIGSTYLKVNQYGEMQRKMKSGSWKYIENNCNHGNGMNVLIIEEKQYTRHKIMGCVYFKLDFDKSYTCIFKDKNRMNCNINNIQFIPCTNNGIKKYVS